MSAAKSKMSASYVAMFVFSIVMLLGVIIGGMASRSKSSGFGIWIWGYTVWLIYKRDNNSLVALQKNMLWLDGIAILVGLYVLITQGAAADHSVGVWITILGAISLVITYGYMAYFKRQIQVSREDGREDPQNSSDIADRYWEDASRELASARNEGAWAKAYALTDGDDAKARALYIRQRAKAIKDLDIPLSTFTAKRTSNVLVDEARMILDSLNAVGKIGVVGIVGLIGYAYYNTNNTTQSTAITDQPSSNTMGLPPNAGELPANSGQLRPNLAPVQVGRGASWESNVSRLRKGILESSISVSDMSVESLSNPFDVFDKPQNKNKEAVSSELVSAIEAQNIWWIDGAYIFVRLYNPANKNISDITFSLSNSACGLTGNRIFLSFDLAQNSLSPSSFGVYSGRLPFDYKSTFGKGTKCGIVEAALMVN